jgi:methionyl-tRNA formyltransferase
MRLIFLGTPQFAAVILEALLSHHEVAAVLTQPDKPAKRGLSLQKSPVKITAEAAGVPVFQPTRLRDANLQQILQAMHADALIVAAYGLILPESFLQMTALGAINIHASLLPRWRGAAPIQRAIEAGDTQTGISIMQMEKGLDTGPVWIQESLPILREDTAETLGQKLAKLGATMILRFLESIESNKAMEAKPQNEEEATYAKKIDNHEAIINWHEAAVVIERKIRAFYPDPVAKSTLSGTPVRFFKAMVEPKAQGKPGAILAIDQQGILVACGQGGIWLQQLQRAGGRPMPATEWAKGVRFSENPCFGS